MAFFIFNLMKNYPNPDTNNIKVNNNIIEFDSLSLKQKLGQMIMVRGDNKDLDFNDLNIGGIFLDRQNSSEDYRQIIKEFQDNSKIKLLVSTDLEGSWTPFHNPHDDEKFKSFSEINSSLEAYDIGLKHGELLKKIGFNLNFAPVSEYYDLAYGGRVFLGTKKEVSDKISSYINGLQKNVYGTCKHYPGKALIANLHNNTDKEEITEDDLELFNVCLENNISSIMVSHQIVYGKLDSNGRPSSVSKEVISTINDSVLIIADEINMQGLISLYITKESLYIDLINSGNNLILDFDLTPQQSNKLLNDLEKDVISGKIKKDNIDHSVKKILTLKGYKLV